MAQTRIWKLCKELKRWSETHGVVMEELALILAYLVSRQVTPLERCEIAPDPHETSSRSHQDVVDVHEREEEHQELPDPLVGIPDVLKGSLAILLEREVECFEKVQLELERSPTYEAFVEYFSGGVRREKIALMDTPQGQTIVASFFFMILERNTVSAESLSCWRSNVAHFVAALPARLRQPLPTLSKRLFG